MKWQGRRQSANVDDQRGRRSGGSMMGGLPGGMLSKGGLGVIVVVLLISWLMGGNPLTLLQQMGSGSSGFDSYDQSTYVASPEEEELASFTKVVLAETEDVWNNLLDGYREPTLVLFTGSVQSGCGHASSATGPFYCSADERLYIDLVHAMRDQLSEEEYNKLSVKLELQADFFAGVWAHYADRMANIVQSGDLEEAITAASAIGDDRLQMEARGHVVPDSFTHGTSEQRMRWFRKGYESGDLNQGDTFNSESL